MDEEELSYEMLQDLLRTERRSNKPTPLPPRFWADIRAFLDDLVAAFRVEQEKDPFSRRAMLLRDEVTNGRHAAEALWALRERKLAMLALAHTDDRQRPQGITPDERALYDRYLGVLKEFRDKALGASGTANATPAAPAGLPSSPSVPPVAPTVPAGPAASSPAAGDPPAGPPAHPPAHPGAHPAARSSVHPSADAPADAPAASAAASPDAPTATSTAPATGTAGAASGLPGAPDEETSPPPEAADGGLPDPAGTSRAAPSVAAPPSGEKAPLPPPVVPSDVVGRADLVTIRALGDIPAFVGPDMQTYRLKEGDLVTVPPSIAGLLERRKKAVVVTV